MDSVVATLNCVILAYILVLTNLPQYILVLTLHPLINRESQCENSHIARKLIRPLTTIWMMIDMDAAMMYCCKIPASILFAKL